MIVEKEPRTGMFLGRLPKIDQGASKEVLQELIEEQNKIPTDTSKTEAIMILGQNISERSPKKDKNSLVLENISVNQNEFIKNNGKSVENKKDKDIDDEHDEH